MKEELDKLLCEKYPKIFANRYGDMRETAMCWGFECGDGWFNIIDKLCANIQNHIDWRERSRQFALEYNDALRKALDGDNTDLIKYYANNKKETEWIVKRVAQDIEWKQFRKVEEEIPQVVASQVKEKFGGLRFYYDGGDDYISGLSSMAESMSYVTCERCGNPGKPNDEGWIQTLCENHRHD